MRSWGRPPLSARSPSVPRRLPARSRPVSGASCVDRFESPVNHSRAIPKPTSAGARGAGLALAALLALGLPHPGATVPAGPPAAQRVVSGRTPRPAVAFSPDGRLLAAAGYRRVDLLDAEGIPIRALPVPEGTVTGVQFSPDGRRLAASCGSPGRSGLIRVWQLPSLKVTDLSGAHSDVVDSLAWGPDSRTLAAGSYDHLVSLWDVDAPAGAARLRILKDHTDAVYGVALSPDGRRVASVSGDRTLKVWDAATGKRLYTFSEATAELYGVAFSPDGRQVAAGGVDRSLRVWNVGATSGRLARAAFAHEGPIIRVLFTPDGSGIVTTSEDRMVKLWDAAELVERKVYERQPDWAQGIALNRDGSRLAVSRYDGSLAVYDLRTGDPLVRVSAGRAGGTGGLK